MTDRDGMYVHVTAKGAMVRQLGLADSRLYQISRAVRWIRDHHAEMLRIRGSGARCERERDIVLSALPCRHLIGDVAAVGYAVGLESFQRCEGAYGRRWKSSELERFQARCP